MLGITKRRLFTASTTAGFLMSLVAGFGVSAVAEEQADDSRPIEEVIVTASKREVSLQDSSLAISAFTGEQLDKRGIREFTDIASAIPGIDMSEATPTESIVIIRGISTNGRGYHRAEVWRQQTNASYLDDIALFPGATPLKMVDMARLEVFKGPQGTQFGKSAMAGAVRFVSNEPDTSAFAANINGSFNKVGSSDDMTNQLEGFVNIPVTDTIALRVAGYRHDNAGFIDVDGNHNIPDANWEETSGIRLRAKWDIGDRVRWHATVFNQKTEVGDTGRPQTTWEPSTTNSVWDMTGMIPMNPEDPKRQFLEPGDSVEKIRSTTVEVDFDAFTLSATGADLSNHARFARNVMWECNPDGWCEGATAGGLTANGHPIAFHGMEGPNFRAIETFEVRAVSNVDPGDRVSWLGGIYYENNNQKRAGRFYWLSDDHEALNNIAEWPGGCDWDDNGTPRIRNNGDWFYQKFQYNNSDEKAIYGEVTFNVSDPLRVTAAVRRASLRGNFYEGGDAGCWGETEGQLSRTSDWDDVNTYRFDVKYDVSDDIMLFAFAASGYRMGGRNFFSVNGVSMESDYESDSLWNYEVGVRSTWQDGRLLFNSSIYRVDWSDMQQPEFRPGRSGREMTNIGESEITGFEMLAIYAVNEDLDITFNASYRTSEVLSHPYNPQYVGMSMPGSSNNDWQWSALLDWRTEIGNNTLAEVNATFRSVPSRSGHWSPQEGGEAYRVLDGNVNFTRGNFEYSVFARNMLDKRAVSWQTPGYPGWPEVPAGGSWRDQFVAYYAVILPVSYTHLRAHET